MLLFAASPKIELTEYLDYKLDSPVNKCKAEEATCKKL